MKVFKIILAVGFVFGLAANVVGFEGNGSDMPIGIHGHGAGDGTGPIHDVFGGEPVTVTGTVSDVGAYGDGFKMDTGDEIYGIGPLFYWEEQDIARPSVGETITVTGTVVTFSDGSKKTIAIDITIGALVVHLRDPKTGLPLWRRNSENGQGWMKRDHRRGFMNQTCPAADPDSEETL